MIMEKSFPQVPQVPLPSFPSVNMQVLAADGDNCNVIMEFVGLQPHELSAVLAVFRPNWKLVITHCFSHDE